MNGSEQKIQLNLRCTYRHEWGPWTLDREVCTLTHADTDYEIDLERCSTAAEVLDSIIQIADKTWGDARTVAGLVQAVSSLLDPQAFLCPSGQAKRLSTRQIRKLVDQAGDRE